MVLCRAKGPTEKILTTFMLRMMDHASRGMQGRRPIVDHVHAVETLGFGGLGDRYALRGRRERC